MARRDHPPGLPVRDGRRPPRRHRGDRRPGRRPDDRHARPDGRRSASPGSRRQPGWTVEAELDGLGDPLAPAQRAPHRARLELAARSAETAMVRRTRSAARPHEDEDARGVGRTPTPGAATATASSSWHAEVPDVAPWSAELPALYDAARHAPLARTARSSSGRASGSASGASRSAASTCWSTAQRVYIRGVNRHDFDQHTGRVDRARRRCARTSSQMKQFGFNAVRTSHYPNDPGLPRPDRRARAVRHRRGRHRVARVPEHAVRRPALPARSGSSRVVADGPARQEPPVGHRLVARQRVRATAPTTTPPPPGCAATTRRRPLHYEGAIRFDWDERPGRQRHRPARCTRAIAAIVDHARSGRAAPPADHVRVLARDGQQQRHPRRVLGRHRVDARAPGRLHLGVVGPRPRPDAARRHDRAGPMAATSATSPTTATSASTAWSGRTARPKPALWEHQRARGAASASPAIGSDVRARPDRGRRTASTSATSAGCARHCELAVDGESIARGRRSSCRRSGRASAPRSPLPGWPAPSCRPVGEALADRPRSATAAASGLGAGRLRGLLRRSCRSPIDATARRQRAPPAGRRRDRVDRVDGDGRLEPRAPRVRRRPCPCGAPRPTTTGSAGWRHAGREWGLDRLERRLARRRGARATSTVVTPKSGRAPASSSRTSSGSRRSPAAAIAVDETVDIPDALDRPGPGRDRARGRARARGPRVVRHGARTRPTPTASAAGSSAAGARPSTRRSTCPTSGRRRTAATPTSAGWSCADERGRGLRIELDEPRQVSATHLRAADLAAATHDVEVDAGARDRSSTSTPPIAASGTASCGPDTLPGSTSSARARYHWAGRSRRSARPDAMTVEWRADDRQFHLRNERLSYVMRVYEDGTLGHLHLGRAARRRPLVPPPRPGPVRAASRTASGEPVAARVPDQRHRRLPGPGARRSRTADGSTVARPALPRAPDRRRQAGPRAGLPVDVRRGRRRGRDARGRARRRAERPSRSTCAYTIFRDRPVIARSATHPERRRRTGRRCDCAMSAVARPPRRATGMLVQLSRRLGPRAARRRAAARARAASRIGSARGASSHQHNPFLALRRADDRPRHTGEALRLQPRLLGQLPRRGRGRPVSTRTRVRLGIEPDTFAWRLEPGAAFTTPEAVVAWSDAGLGALSRRVPRPVPGAARTRHVARPAAPGPAQQLGGDLLRLRRGQARRDRARSARELGVELFVLDDGWFGQRDDDTTSLGDWFVDRRKLPDGLDGVARADQALGIGFGAVDRARDGQRATATCSRRTRTGRSASPAGRGPRAASSSSWTWHAPRWSTTCSACSPTSSRARRSPTSSGT